MKKLGSKIKQWFESQNEPTYWIGRQIKYQVNSFWNFTQWRKTKRRCIRAWKYTGLQHHIVPASDSTLMIVNNRWLKWYNKQPGIQKKIDIRVLLESAYFSTPQGNRLITKN